MLAHKNDQNKRVIQPKYETKTDDKWSGQCADTWARVHSSFFLDLIAANCLA